MRSLLAAGMMAIAGMGHNLPPLTVQMPYAERMQIEHRIKRAENKKLWQKLRRKRKWSQRTRYHKLSWSQRKGRLFKGHRP